MSLRCILLFIFTILTIGPLQVLAETVEIDLSSGHLNVRTSKRTGNNKCARVYKGQRFKKLSEIGNWTKIKINSGSCKGEAWINSYYTKGKYMGKRGRLEASVNENFCKDCAVRAKRNEAIPVNTSFRANNDKIAKAFQTFVAKGVPANALAETLAFYQDNLSQNGGLKERQCLRRNSKALKQGIKNQRYVMLIDYRKGSNEKRAFMLDMKTLTFKKYMVAHGKGSGSRNGVPTRFTNRGGQKTTVIGPHITSSVYKFRNSLPAMRLDGVSWSNNTANETGKVTHVAQTTARRGSSYVTNGGGAGRSWGCPAFSYGDFMKEVYPKMQGGALWYHYTSDSMRRKNNLRRGCGS